MTVNCPSCRKPVLWDAANVYRPFCSQRCRLIDLGQWATESYRVPIDEAPLSGAPSDPEN